MKIKITLILLLFASLLSAQTKGVVKDSITGQPIPYVSIWVENENIGTTSEENGTFSINTTSKSKTLIFSALGFKTKNVSVSKAAAVHLSPTSYQIEEVTPMNIKGTLWREIGTVESSVLEAFDNGPKIAAKFFSGTVPTIKEPDTSSRFPSIPTARLRMHRLKFIFTV